MQLRLPSQGVADPSRLNLSVRDPVYMPCLGGVLGVVVGGACATILCVAGDIEAKLVCVPGGRWNLESELTLGGWSGWNLAVALEIEACRWKRIEA